MVLGGAATARSLLVARRGQQVSGTDDPVGGILVGAGWQCCGPR